MARTTEYQKLEAEIRDFADAFKTAVVERDAAIEQLKLLRRALDAPEWRQVWELLNAFASGETQKQWSRVEPTAVLAETYQGCAIIYGRAQQALKALKVAGLLSEEEEEVREDSNHTEVA